MGTQGKNPFALGESTFKVLLSLHGYRRYYRLLGQMHHRAGFQHSPGKVFPRLPDQGLSVSRTNDFIAQSHSDILFHPDAIFPKQVEADPGTERREKHKQAIGNPRQDTDQTAQSIFTDPVPKSVKEMTHRRSWSAPSHSRFMNAFQKLCKQKMAAKKRRWRKRPPPLINCACGWVLSTGSSAQPVPGSSGYRNPSLSLSAPRRELINLRPCPTLQPFGFPYGKTLPQIIGVESQRFADVGKRKQPITVCILNPILGLLKKNLALTLARKNVLLKTRNGILQHRQHELLFRLQMQLSPESVQILLRQKRVGLKQRGDSFLHAQSSFVTHKTHLPIKCSLPSNCDKGILEPVTLRLKAKRSRRSNPGKAFSSNPLLSCW